MSGKPTPSLETPSEEEEKKNVKKNTSWSEQSGEMLPPEDDSPLEGNASPRRAAPAPASALAYDIYPAHRRGGPEQFHALWEQRRKPRQVPDPHGDEGDMRWVSLTDREMLAVVRAAVATPGWREGKAYSAENFFGKDDIWHQYARLASRCCDCDEDWPEPGNILCAGCARGR